MVGMGPNGPFSSMFTNTIMTGYFQDRLNSSLVTIYDFNSRSEGVLPSIQDGSTRRLGSRAFSCLFTGGRPPTGAETGAKLGAAPAHRIAKRDARAQNRSKTARITHLGSFWARF